MDEKKTVCLLNDSFPPLIDGVANAVVNYAKHLPKSGMSPVVITPDHPQADDEKFPYPIVRYPSIDTRKKLGYLAGVPFSPEIANRVSGENVAVLHSHCPIMSNFMARQLRQIVDAPLVMTYHTKFDVEIDSFVKNRMLQEGGRKILAENINACDEVWTVSCGAGENLRDLGYEGEYIVMPNGVDLPCERVSDELIRKATEGYDLPQGVPVYLFAGRIRWYKGLRIILDALANLNAVDRDFRMVFVGDGTDREAVESYARECGVAGKCIFTGAIHDRDLLRAWYCRADLFLFPSTYDTNGLVVREAAACGLASVLIKDSCASEGVTDGRNGFLIEENPRDLLRCLYRLQEHPETMAAAGEAAAKELYISWESAVRLAAERYEVVIDRYRSGKYPTYRKPMEYYLKANGELMEDLGHLVKLRDQMKQFIKDF